MAKTTQRHDLAASVRAEEFARTIQALRAPEDRKRRLCKEINLPKRAAVNGSPRGGDRASLHPATDPGYPQPDTKGGGRGLFARADDDGTPQLGAAYS